MLTGMTYHVREMKPADYAEVAELWRQSEGIGLSESDQEAPVARFLRRNPGMSCVACLADGQIIGAVLCGHDGRRGYLHHLAVAAPWRRRGIAGQLLRFCFDALAKAAIPKCNIFVFADNPSGKEFWLHNGWTARGDLHVLQKVVTPSDGRAS
jgi:N-acetylglutamate synthase